MCNIYNYVEKNFSIELRSPLDFQATFPQLRIVRENHHLNSKILRINLKIQRFQEQI